MIGQYTPLILPLSMQSLHVEVSGTVGVRADKDALIRSKQGQELHTLTQCASFSTAKGTQH